jgi:predicted ester cyclase
MGTTAAPTGKKATFDEMVILQIRDGKVVRQRGVVDNLSALRQLGAVPSPRS